MSETQQRKVYYTADHYLNLEGFKPPVIKRGVRGISRAYEIINVIVFLVIATALSFYLYTQALSLEAANKMIEEGTFFSSVFFVSLGGAAVALPLILLTMWMLRKTFVQPVFTYINMFLHGAGFSVLASLAASGFASDAYTAAIELTQSNPLSFFATIHAPIFEELFKGLGLLFMLFALPAFVRTVHDGVIYGMLIGFGFAFTENIQYFIQYGNEPGSFFYLLIVRILASLFTHAIFTGAIGLIMAYFWCKYGTYRKALIGWSLGMIVAIALHALWNGASSVGLFFFIYVIFFFPLFTAANIILKKTANKIDESYVPILKEYSEAGWFPESFYRGLFPKIERKRTIRFLDGAERKKIRAKASALSELVFIRKSIENSPKPQPFIKREREILISLFMLQDRERNQKAKNPQ